MTYPALSRLYRPDELRELALLACSRTLSPVPEVTLPARSFCQPVDIAIAARGDSSEAIANMPGYPMRSAANAAQYIQSVTAAGIKTVMLRMDTPPDMQRSEALTRQCAILTMLRTRFSAEELQIIIDPFSLALNKDKTWGVMHDGKLDYLETAALFSELTSRFAEAGASYVLTLGRFEREVDIAVRTLATDKNATTDVSSFSTNTETTNAYVYADHGAYALTKQKILVTNYGEMVFRALVDMYEGSRLVIVKPAENLHVLEKTKTLIQDPALLQQFLSSEPVRSMVKGSAYLQRVHSDMQAKPDAFARTAAKAGLGAYTVSGTYFLDMQTRERKGDAFLASVLYERFANIAGVLSGHSGSGMIIDRNAYWFLQHQQ
jgi:delta-aminolevulinic acid dehydratase/porphobilinogen synthase